MALGCSAAGLGLGSGHDEVLLQCVEGSAANAGHHNFSQMTWLGYGGSVSGRFVRALSAVGAWEIGQRARVRAGCACGLELPDRGAVHPRCFVGRR